MKAVKVVCRQQDQRELRRQRKRLRDLCSSSGDGGGDLLDPGDVEDLCKELSRQQIEALCDGLEKVSGTEEKTTLLDSAMQDLHASRGEVRLGSFCSRAHSKLTGVA